MSDSEAAAASEIPQKGRGAGRHSAREVALQVLYAIDLGSRKAFPQVVYIGMSSNEAGFHPEQAELNARYVKAAQTLGDFLKSKVERVKVVIGDGQTHNEVAWAERLPGAIEFVFPAE